MTTGDLLGWLSDHDWKPETRHAVRSSLRSFYAWAVGEGHAAGDPAARLPAVSRSPAHPRPIPDRLLADAMRAAPERERLMMRLAAEVGLRRGEICQVHTRDLLEDLSGWSLVVHGKGGRRRTVPLPESLGLELSAREAGYVFPGQIDGHLSAGHVGVLVKDLLPTGWTLHTLRHRFASASYAIDRDVLTVQALLGHSSADTTRRYVRLPDGAARRLVNSVRVGVA